MTDITKVVNNIRRKFVGRNDGTYSERGLSGGNFLKKFRDAFENFQPNVAGSNWATQVANGDLLSVEGNCLGASYLSISRGTIGTDTLTETIVETTDSFYMPMDISIGLHMSQRVVGMPFYVEIVDAQDSLPDFTPIAISSISQATTTLTITTSSAHGFQVGQRFAVYGVPDSRLNYPTLVVATTPSTTQFTATAGPSGTIPSLTIGPFTSGFVLGMSALGRRHNGTSVCFENTTATNASFFVRSDAGDVFPSGTALGNHSVSVGTTASVLLANTPGAVAFAPTTEYRLTFQEDRIQWADSTVDGTSGYISRTTRSQVVPNPNKQYKLRFRFGQNPSLSRPVGGKIVSAVKSGSTTATITTSEPHGLTTSDQICIYGIIDQTNFANQTTAVAVASIINTTQFTVVFGASATSTSFGGAVVRVNGANLPSALGYLGQSIQTAVLSNGILTITGNTSWSGFSYGDIVDIYGADSASGISRGIDYNWRVRGGTGSTMILQWMGAGSPPADFGSASCSGVVIRHTCARISFVRLFDYDSNSVDVVPRAVSDLSASVPVLVNNSLTSSVTGFGAHDSAVSGFPVRIGARALTAQYTPVQNGDTIDLTSTTVGAFITKPFAIPEAGFNASLSLTTTTAVAIAAAGGANIKRHLTACQAINTGAAAVDLIILDGVTERWRLTLPVNVPVCFDFPTEITTTANTALNANLSAAGTVRANFQGYTAP